METPIEHTGSSSNRVSVLLIASTTIICVGFAFLYVPLLHQYGFRGATRYIWVGDAYPQEVRFHIDAMENIERKLENDEKILEGLEDGLSQVLLNSDDTSIIRAWQSVTQQHNLHKVLAKLSYDLDQHAYRVDQVFLQNNEFQSLKLQKKKLSTRLVGLMERTDKLISIFDNERR
jgi:hypothetical protein